MTAVRGSSPVARRVPPQIRRRLRARHGSPQAVEDRATSFDWAPLMGAFPRDGDLRRAIVGVVGYTPLRFADVPRADVLRVMAAVGV